MSPEPFNPDEGWVVYFSAYGGPPQLLQDVPDVWGPTTGALVFRERGATDQGIKLGHERARCWWEPAWHFFPDQYRPPGLSDQEWQARRKGPVFEEPPPIRFVRRKAYRLARLHGVRSRNPLPPS